MLKHLLSLTIIMMLSACSLVRSMHHQHDYDNDYQDPVSHHRVDVARNLDQILPPPPGSCYHDNPDLILRVQGEITDVEKRTLDNIVEDQGNLTQALDHDRCEVSSRGYNVLHQARHYVIRFRAVADQQVVITVMDEHRRQLPVAEFSSWWRGLALTPA